jgi:predicted PurR-regulated permease PerM
VPGILVKGLSRRAETDARKILSEMNYAVCTYIQGQFIISFIVGVLKYIGFLMIGLNYSLLLGIISFILNMIPFVGPFIALIFAVIVGLTQSVKIGLLVVVIVIVAQQIADNIISPHMLGNKLQIHPLTIILLLLFAGNLDGFMGLFLAVPVYAVLKVVISNALRIRKIKKDGAKKHKTNPIYEEEIIKEV